MRVARHWAWPARQSTSVAWSTPKRDVTKPVTDRAQARFKTGHARRRGSRPAQRRGCDFPTLVPPAGATLIRQKVAVDDHEPRSR